MNSLINRTNLFTLSVATMSLMVFSGLANAEIYKWRNNRGVIQYSDKPPVAGFTKANQHEIVNSLQAKDLCVEPSAKTAMAASANKKLEANFFGINNGGLGRFGGVTAPKQLAAPTASIFGKPASTLAARPAATTSNIAARPVTNNYAPFNGGSRFFGFGGKQVTVFGKPVNTANNFTPKPAFSFSPIPTAVAAPKPTVVTTPAPLPTTVVTAPAATPTPLPLPTTVVTAPAATPTPLPTPTAPSATPPASTGPNILQSGLMPAVDISKNVIPATGFSTLRIQPTTVTTASTPGEGSFRINCAVSHMSNDDPIVYPNQKGAAHHHTFFGNTSANFSSNVNNMASTGNSTCSGGIANRSAYWIPSLIDTTTNTPISEIDALFYYKTGYGGVPTNLIVAPPKGLRMISGNPKATTADAAKVGYLCIPQVGETTKWTTHIQNCNVSDSLLMSITFPQCWDGKNLDSPDHISHMAQSGAKTFNGCPTTHPVPIPVITFNARFKITKPNQALNWRLASDNYAKSSPGGYSGHSDWVNGWDETVMAGIIKNCINASRDCHAFLLGNGTTLY